VTGVGALPAVDRRLRKNKPYQLEDRVEQLFHEKSVISYSAWNRLVDETIASLRFKVGSKSLAIEPTLNLMRSSPNFALGPSAALAHRYVGVGKNGGRDAAHAYQ
jgi:oligoendopeptidase F